MNASRLVGDTVGGVSGEGGETVHGRALLTREDKQVLGTTEQQQQQGLDISPGLIKSVRSGPQHWNRTMDSAPG